MVVSAVLASSLFEGDASLGQLVDVFKLGDSNSQSAQHGMHQNFAAIVQREMNALYLTLIGIVNRLPLASTTFNIS